MKKIKNIVAFLIALALVAVLANPAWLPLSAETGAKLRELEQNHFLLEGSGGVTLAHVLALALALCVVWLVYRLCAALLRLAGGRSARAQTVAGLFAAALRYLAVIVALVWGLSILGVSSTAVLAGVGIVGLILGFGAQSLIEDIITGAFIIFEGQYNVGDIIVLDDFRGVVRSIGVRTTTIEDTGGNLKIVNNSDIRNLQNRSRVASLAVCDVDVSYATDLRRVEELVETALPEMYLRRQELYAGIPEYYGVESLAASGMTLRFVVPVKEANIFRARRAFNRDIKIFFDEHGVEIPFPQVDVHMKN